MSSDYKTDIDRVSDLVLNRLIECGWRDQVRLACRKILAENEGNNITIEDLVNKVTVKARSIVPDSVKRELLHELEVVESKGVSINKNK